MAQPWTEEQRRKFIATMAKKKEKRQRENAEYNRQLENGEFPLDAIPTFKRPTFKRDKEIQEKVLTRAGSKHDLAIKMIEAALEMLKHG